MAAKKKFGGDARKAKTLGQASANGDGTFNGARAIAWLSEAMHPGAGLSEAEVLRLWDEQQKKTRAQDVDGRDKPGHDGRK
ncbi:MAG: hypothetical protein WD871_01770 [Xanthobacteraceae bacterium]